MAEELEWTTISIDEVKQRKKSIKFDKLIEAALKLEKTDAIKLSYETRDEAVKVSSSLNYVIDHREKKDLLQVSQQQNNVYVFKRNK